MIRKNYQISAFGLAKESELLSQDCYRAKIFDDIVIGIVCDGVGSALKGREAACRVVEYMINNFKNRPKSWSIEKSIKTFVKNINQILYKEGILEYERSEFLTTLSMVVIYGDRLYGVNVGDSPIFLYREGTLKELSIPHIESEGSHILTEAIGAKEDVDFYYFENIIKEGDKILIGSDGLIETLTKKEIKEKIFDATFLVKYASSKFNHFLPDDVSVVIIDIKSVDKRVELKNQNLPIPTKLKRGEEIDGFLLLESLIANERTWLVKKRDIKYVMKFPLVEAIENEDILDAFIQEAWNAKRLKAGFFPKSVIPKNRSYRYYIMEYIEGESLEEILKKRKLHIEEAIDLAKFLIKASSYLLKFNLVHGDIKPQNIILKKRGNKSVFKLVDFGNIVEIFSIQNRAGTPSYLAPERLRGTSLNESSEIFAIGVTLYKALSKKLPYGEIEPFSNPIFKKPKRLKELNRNIPPWFEAIVMRAIERDFQRRYAHYSEMDFELKNPDKVKPYFDPELSLIEREPLKVYKIAFIVSFLINILLIFLLIK